MSTLPKDSCVGFSKVFWNIRNLSSIENSEEFTYYIMLVLMYTCQLASSCNMSHQHVTRCFTTLGFVNYFTLKEFAVSAQSDYFSAQQLAKFSILHCLGDKTFQSNIALRITL